MGKKVLLTQSPTLDKHSTNTQGWEEAKAFKLSNCLQFLKAAIQSLIKIHPKGQARQPRWLTEVVQKYLLTARVCGPWETS